MRKSFVFRGGTRAKNVFIMLKCQIHHCVEGSRRIKSLFIGGKIADAPDISSVIQTCIMETCNYKKIIQGLKVYLSALAIDL